MIIKGDCLKQMKMFADNSFDLCFCSPPYEDARTYGIDFSLKGQDWVDWALERFVECVRVTKGLVAWVVEGKTHKFNYSATPFLLVADLKRAGIHLRKPPIFQRVGIPGSGGPDWLRNDYELIICATSGGKLPWSDNTACGHPPKWAPGGAMSHRLSDGTRRNQWGGAVEKGGNNRRKDGSRQKSGRPSHEVVTKKGVGTRGSKNGDIQTAEGYVPPKLANPANVIKGNVGKGHMGDDLAHENEAPFPEWLAEFFVKSFCPPDGIVFDPFIGSGTSAAAAIRNGRQYCGIDVRQSQVDLTNQRLEKLKESLSCSD